MRKIPKAAREQINKTIELLDELLDQMGSYVEERSDSWPESDAGYEYDDWSTSYSEARDDLANLTESPDGDEVGNHAERAADRFEQLRAAETQKLRKELRSSLRAELRAELEKELVDIIGRDVHHIIRGHVEKQFKDDYRRQVMIEDIEEDKLDECVRKWFESHDEADQDILLKTGLMPVSTRPKRPRL